MANNISEQASQFERRVGCDIGDFSRNAPGRASLTNILSPKNRARFVMPANFFTDNNKTIKLRIWGTESGTGSKTIYFAVVNNKTFDKFQSLHKASLAGQTGNFFLEIVVTTTGAATQQVHSMYVADTGLTKLANGSSAVRFNSDRIFRLYGEVTDPQDLLTVNRYEMFVCG